MREYQFQKDAIRSVLNAFRNGKKRYLVADEAGLGKTFVARGVIEGLMRNNSLPTIVFYFSSNIHLLEKTLDKLKKNNDKIIDVHEVELSQENKKIPKVVKIDRLSIAGALACAGHFKFEEGKTYIFAFSANLITDKNSKHNAIETNIMNMCEKDDVAKKGFLEKREYFNKTAFELLKPNLVIADEFHRYIAEIKKIAEISSESSSNLIMLSATPYVVRKDDWKKGDYLEKVNDLIENEGDDTGKGFSFMELLKFLVNEEKDLEEYFSLWEKKNITKMESFLKQYIWRNERVVCNEKYLDIPMKEEFVSGKYDECIDYLIDCKHSDKRFFSLCPGAWSFGIRGWKKIEGDSVAKLYDKLDKNIEETSLKFNDFLFNSDVEHILDKIKHCLKTRLIYEYAVEKGRDLLWVPPSAPMYRFGGPYVEQKDFTKLLVFSGYTMVPRMVATVFSELADNSSAINVCNLDDSIIEETIGKLAEIDKIVCKTPGLVDNLSECWCPIRKKNMNIEDILGEVKETFYKRKIQDLICISSETMAKYIIASPLICSYRILNDLEGSKKIAEAFINYFKQGAIVKCLKRQNCTDVDKLLMYCGAGNIQAMLYEYAFSEEDWNKKIIDALGFKGSKLFVINTPNNIIDGREIQCRFAERYTSDHDDNGASGTSKQGEENLTTIEDAFQSPFWPMIMSTTSIGQEGIDMDAYCSRIMHYSIPSTPMAFEQRDGRVDRRRSLLARRKMVLQWGDEVNDSDYANFWNDVFSRGKGLSGLAPDWVQIDDKTDLKQERIIPFFPYSEEYILYRRLVECKNIYRSQMGNPNEIEL